MTAQLRLVPPAEETRVCRKCEAEKGLDQFRVYKNGKRRWSCNTCVNAAIEAWRRDSSTPESVEKRRAGHRKRSKASYLKNPARSNAYGRAWRLRNPEQHREICRSIHLRKHFGITTEDYERLLVAQSGRCAICLQPETVILNGKVKRLAVDHDHETGAVRGLLCCNCNLSVGYAADDPDRLRAAANYLERA